MSAYLCQVKLKKNQISFCIYYIFFPVSTMTCFFFVSFFFLFKCKDGRDTVPVNEKIPFHLQKC